MAREDPAEPFKDLSWPHAPTHRLSKAGTYFVTVATYRKEHHFRGRDRLAVLQRGLLSACSQYAWRLEAWAVFSNHYHFVAHSPPDGAENLSSMLAYLHEKTAKWVNTLDEQPGRDVWHNFWDKALTFERSYFARLSYTHRNAVKHGLVAVAENYPWCSAAWFRRTATPAQVRTIYSFRTDRLNVPDDFEPAPEW